MFQPGYHSIRPVSSETSCLRLGKLLCLEIAWRQEIPQAGWGFLSPQVVRQRGCWAPLSRQGRSPGLSHRVEAGPRGGETPLPSSRVPLSLPASPAPAWDQ